MIEHSLSHTSICGVCVVGVGLALRIVKTCILAEFDSVEDWIRSGWEIISIVVVSSSHIED